MKRARKDKNALNNELLRQLARYERDQARFQRMIAIVIKALEDIANAEAPVVAALAIQHIADKATQAQGAIDALIDTLEMELLSEASLDTLLKSDPRMSLLRSASPSIQP